MSTAQAKRDIDLQTYVTDELRWDPSIHDSRISALVHKGIVTLKGSVPHIADKLAAVSAAQRIKGVRAVANEIEAMSDVSISDEAIAEAAVNAIEWNYYSPSTVKISVANGTITLLGEAVWDFQRIAAAEAVQGLKGVVAVNNGMTVRPIIIPIDIKHSISDALARSAHGDMSSIDITVDSGRVLLKGTVNSRAKIEEARKAAWSAPGVVNVTDELMIEH